MLEARTLGWYSDGGSCVIALDVAESPQRFAMVANHESTHQIIAYTTTHGFATDVLELGRTFRFSATGTALAQELYTELFKAGRATHEGTATYCGLVDFEDDELAREVSSLPIFYQNAYAIFEDLLSRYQFDALERYRLARAIGCRAMQTDVLTRWISDELWVPANLRSFLSHPHRHPDRRLTSLVRSLRQLSGEELRQWAGGHIRGDSTFVLTPPEPGPMSDLPFTPMPELDKAQGIARKIAARVFPSPVAEFAHPPEFTKFADFPEFDVLGHGGRTEFVLAPPSFDSIPADAADLSWPQEADLAMVIRSPLDVPFEFQSPFGGQFVSSGSAVVMAFRPDFRAAREYRKPLNKLAELLEDIDPAERMPLCLVGDSILPDPEGLRVGPSVRDWIAPFAKQRPTLGYTGGTMMGLHMWCGLLSGIGSPLLIHRMRVGETWALILVRSREATWPMAVHPILIYEWARQGEMFYKTHPLERETPSEEFFGGSPANVVPVLAFLREYRGEMVAHSEWVQYIDATSRAEYASVPVAVPLQPDGPSFRDSLQ